MEKRIGVVGIVIENKESVQILNQLLSDNSELIIGRMGVPRSSVNVIALIVEGNNDAIGALTGRLGSLKGIKVRSALTNHIITEE